MERHRIAIVIPALNEAATIGPVVVAAARSGLPIVVDDGSTDATAVVASAAGATVVRHGINMGYDAALNSGFQKADELKCDYIITADADGQHDPLILFHFIRELEDGADIVIGVRDSMRRIGEKIFAWVGRRRWGIADPLCGMKAYRASLYRQLGHFDSYGSIGTELAIFAAKREKKIAQVPVVTAERMDAPRFGTGISANRRILRALWRGIRG